MQKLQQESRVLMPQVDDAQTTILFASTSKFPRDQMSGFSIAGQ
jgi:hypothetical protein